VPQDFFGEGVDPVVENATWEAIAVLESLGVHAKETSMPNLKYALSAYYVQAMSEASSNLARYSGINLRTSSPKRPRLAPTFSENRASGFGKEVKRRLLLGTYALSAGYYDKYYLKARKARALISRDFQRVFKPIRRAHRTNNAVRCV